MRAGHGIQTKHSRRRRRKSVVSADQGHRLGSRSFHSNRTYFHRAKTAYMFGRKPTDKTRRSADTVNRYRCLRLITGRYRAYYIRTSDVGVVVVFTFSAAVKSCSNAYDDDVVFLLHYGRVPSPPPFGEKYYVTLKHNR